jgi:hypothetical protein
LLPTYGVKINVIPGSIVSFHGHRTWHAVGDWDEPFERNALLLYSDSISGNERDMERKKYVTKKQEDHEKHILFLKNQKEMKRLRQAEQDEKGRLRRERRERKRQKFEDSKSGKD